METNTKTIAFFGASGGCGYYALTRSLAAGHTCIALCRKPEKLTDKLPANQHPNLKVVQGDGLDLEAVKQCLSNPNKPSSLVDDIVFSIGGAFDFKSFTIDQPTVCQDAMDTLIRALSSARADQGMQGSPRIIAVSTTGISQSGARDVPLLFVPMYHVMLKEPHKDKRALEDKIRASGERFTIVRPSLLVDGEAEKTIRVGVDDPVKGYEVKELGYTISRAEVGRWIFQKLIQDDEEPYTGKMVSLTW